MALGRLLRSDIALTRHSSLLAPMDSEEAGTQTYWWSPET
jgi:hypothetical protein